MGILIKQTGEYKSKIWIAKSNVRTLFEKNLVSCDILTVDYNLLLVYLSTLNQVLWFIKKMISFFGKYSCCLLKIGFAAASYYFFYFTTCIIDEFELFTNVLGSRYCDTLEVAIVVFVFMFIFYILGLASVINDSTCNLKTIGRYIDFIKRNKT